MKGEFFSALFTEALAKVNRKFKKGGDLKMSAENQPEIGVSGEQLQQARVALNSLHMLNQGMAQIPEDQLMKQLQVVADLPREGIGILKEQMEPKNKRQKS